MVPHSTYSGTAVPARLLSLVLLLPSRPPSCSPAVTPSLATHPHFVPATHPVTYSPICPPSPSPSSHYQPTPNHCYSPAGTSLPWTSTPASTCCSAPASATTPTTGFGWGVSQKGGGGLASGLTCLSADEIIALPPPLRSRLPACSDPPVLPAFFDYELLTAASASLPFPCLPAHPPTGYISSQPNGFECKGFVTLTGTAAVATVRVSSEGSVHVQLPRRCLLNLIDDQELRYLSGKGPACC